ncbi:hypothetical protein H2198_000515 [Neophaeococcomyces mojaviensis]|uniref:Uncharacterized protein n=1 Tax=Neophaeococcomyces mojaviensis TaxID=3383035 RepID=A0ACC3AJN2_9EURO|nr:hypothetical protein H2198_000515 [Knufia sp. JES_112]
MNCLTSTSYYTESTYSAGMDTEPSSIYRRTVTISSSVVTYCATITITTEEPTSYPTITVAESPTSWEDCATDSYGDTSCAYDCPPYVETATYSYGSTISTDVSADFCGTGGLIYAPFVMASLTHTSDEISSTSTVAYTLTTLDPAPISANQTTTEPSVSSIPLTSSYNTTSTDFDDTTTTQTSSVPLTSTLTPSSRTSAGSSALIQSSPLSRSTTSTELSSSLTNSTHSSSIAPTTASERVPYETAIKRSQDYYRRQAADLAGGNDTFATPVADAWNYLIWTSALGVRRTTSGTVTMTTAAVFTLDVFSEANGALLTSWPTFTATPVLAVTPTTPACIPVTVIQPAAIATGGLLRRDAAVSGGTNAVKPYVERDSTTVVVRIRDNYLDMATNLPTITKSAPQAMLDTVPSSMYTKMTQITSVVQTTDSHGRSTSYSVVVVQPTTVSGTPEATAGGTSAASPTSTWKPTPLAIYERIVDAPFTTASYVGALYMAPILAVVIKILFEAIVASNKMMEPFERLHCAEGSNAEESLFSQYLASSFSFDAFKWAGWERSLPLWTILMYILITVAAPLASASMSVRPMDSCFISDEWRKCDPVWIVNLNFIRVLEVLLVTCIALTCLQLYCSWHYHAGVPSNPTSIVSLAVMLNYDPLVQDLQSVDCNANEEQLSTILKPYHYWLTNHNPSREETRYGLVHLPNAAPPEPPANTLIERFNATVSAWTERLTHSSLPRHTQVLMTDLVHTITMLLLLALLTTYRSDLADNAFNRFFASNTFAPKMVMVILGSLIDIQWKNFEREVRILEPYRRLSHGNARPEVTLLTTLNGTCWSNAPKCFKGLFRYPHMWFEAVIGATAILSDVNIIALSGVLMSDSQTKAAYEFSSITALYITSYMLFIMAIAMLWWRRTHTISRMPRNPDTVGVVLSYLCASRMAKDLADARMEHMSARERDQIIIASGKRYRFGITVCEDGRERWSVDYDDGHVAGEEAIAEKNPYTAVQYK